jgi:arylsulfatase A-like enzyme
VKQLELYDDTLIVFLSDHGEQFQDHGGLGHGPVVYNECLSVPLIIKLPGQRHGREITGTFDLMDIFPTLANYIGIDLAHFDLLGHPVSLNGLIGLRDKYIYSHTDFGPNKVESVQNGSFMLFRNLASGEEKLFDLSADPGELSNLLKARTDVAAKMRNALAQKGRDVNENLSLLGNVGAQELTPQEKNKLRALGYLQ